MTKLLLLSLSIACSLILHAAPRGGEMKHPDFTKGDVVPAGARHDWNLGATGARGWMYSDKLTTIDARQILVTKVESGSPADGVLEVGDVLLGAGGKLFVSDPRKHLGRAISLAEAGSGLLKLRCWRGGKTRDVRLKLVVLGAYSDTAPYRCSKSRKIFARGCSALAKRMSVRKRKKRAITRSLNSLALLASGKEEYLPLLKREARWASRFRSKGYYSWTYSYVLMFLSEYTMATGDTSFEDGMRRLALEIANGQSAVGSWGHRFIQGDGMLGGYGMMNATSIPLTISLILAREAGVKDKVVSDAIAKNAKLVRFYEGKGSVPYGDHHPWLETHEDNGKNGMAALMFNLLGEKRPASFFSRMSLASHGSERDGGHTGNFFNVLWSMPGVAQSGPNACGAWMSQYGGWYYDLARQWDGGFIHQGPPGVKPDSYYGWDCTGAYLLSYALPLRSLHLTGKKKGVLGVMGSKMAKSIVKDGLGWNYKDKNKFYDGLSKERLIKRLGSWSPAVRERAVKAFTKHTMGAGDVDQIIGLLSSSNLNARMGACRVLGDMKVASAVQPLRKCLRHKHLWLRVRAAEALASMGKPGMVAVPELLEMAARGPSAKDPRGMEQRYLNFALFDKMLKGALDGVDRERLGKAIISGLKNEDGRSRGSISRLYKRLSYEEIKPLLPAIYDAVKKAAPSGIMFSAEVRLAGVELLAKHGIKEGMALCFDAMDAQKWGKKQRIGRCLKVLASYGGSVKPLLPKLRQLEKDLRSHREFKSLKKHVASLRKLIVDVESAEEEPELRSIY